MEKERTKKYFLVAEGEWDSWIGQSYSDLASVYGEWIRMAKGPYRDNAHIAERGEWDFTFLQRPGFPEFPAVLWNGREIDPHETYFLVEEYDSTRDTYGGDISTKCHRVRTSNGLSLLWFLEENLPNAKGKVTLAKSVRKLGKGKNKT